MNRKLVIAMVLLSLGGIAYLLLSRGPSRVQIVTIPLQLGFLFSISFVAWEPALGRRKRLLALFGIILVSSIVGIYLDSLVIRIFSALHPIQFLLGFVAFLIEGIVFLGLTWLIDHGLSAVLP
ncbi:MAG TPA: hypothetical protein VLE27_11195, partial [Thermoanaerobaculia bacterium]|nr:hypothetical protein [Thermoanaerobaculia bacterium]